MQRSREDGILREISFAHLHDIVPIVNIIRMQLAHNALFESLVRMHNRSACVDKDSTDIQMACTSVDNFDLQFHLKQNLFIARVSIAAANVNVSLECVINGAVLPESQYATAVLAKTWSLALMMRGILRRGGAISLAATTTSSEKAFVVNENVDSADVKLSQSWLFVPNTADSIKNHQHSTDECHQYVVDERLSIAALRDTLGLGQPPSLLTLFKELEKVEELIPPQKPMNGAHQCAAPPRSEMLAPRTSRIHSENTMTINALSDLDAICDMAANIDDGESNVSEHSSRSSIVERCSPSANEAKYCASIMYFFILQQAPLSNPSDVFEFDDPPRMAPATAMPTSTQQFHFPGPAQNPYPFGAIQSTRGSISAQPTLKRRGRGRKAGNIGDRVLDPSRPIIDPNTGMLASGMSMPTRKPRGSSTTRRPRRPRKAAHMPASPAHAHQFASINRPMLQRSFSEMPSSYPSQMPPVSLSQENRSETISEFDGTEESSDDETDPPPPVRSAAAQPPPAAAKRDSPSLSTSSPGARSSPNLTKMNPEQSGSGSDLKIMIKLKQQAPARPAGPPQSSVSSGVSSSMRLIGQPPSSSSRSKEEKVLLRQKQLKEKNRTTQDERTRKAAKRERKSDLGNSSKKPKLDRPLTEQKTTTTVSPKVEFPQALAFASLKNFKIPKVNEEKCESPTPTTTTPPAAAAAPVSTGHTNTNPSNSSGNLPGTASAPPATLAPASSVAAVGSSSSGTSIFPPKPKSILKTAAEPLPPLFRGIGGVMPPMLPGRRPLLPDPRNALHHPPPR
ncbi:unnamed protein product [Gongylonema pulchrum]|uniref:WH2 domain-containing protein n=1 Tax=Gongylonema pulchrum TaxID=637853 RepID=A0A183CUJ8_9BILA|nr:unnamed protein product [Gongylonema pulchrum]